MSQTIDRRASSRSIVRTLAFAAIAGGLLRIADSFMPHLVPSSTSATFYLITDILLLAGMAGIWLWRRRTLGFAGIAGLAIFVAGILMVRAAAFGVGGYQLGAAVALLGFAAYSIETLIRRSAAPWAPLLWLLALAIGIAGSLGVAPATATFWAGIAFGAGFVAAGVEMISA